jgi:hypothetical protein
VHLNVLFCIPEAADAGVDGYSVWCGRLVALVECSAVEGKYQVVVVLGKLDKTDDGGGDDAAAYSSQTEEPAR